MWIEYIKLKNFRQYGDEKIIFAQPEKERNFIIIQGTNGAGKTNLLNAITWCLYGEEFHLTDKYKGLPLINIQTVAELEPEENCQVEVEIQMREETGQRILFRRFQEFYKTSNGELKSTWPGPSDSKFSMIREINRNMVKVDDPTYILGRLIPKSIERYFFFDGERLNDYFKEATGEKIREAVFKISQLELLDKAIKHLNSMKESFLWRCKDLTPAAEEIRSRLKIYQKSFEDSKYKLQKLLEEKQEAQKKEDEYSGKLRLSSIGDVEKLEEERTSLEKELENINNDIQNLENERLEFLIRFAPYIILYEPLLKIKKLIGDKEEAGDIPPDFKRNFLKMLLQKGRCICGIDITKKNRHRETIENLLMECDEISDISEELMVTDTVVGVILGETLGFREKQVKYGKTIRDLAKRRENINSKVREIDEKIAGWDVEQIKFWESKKQEWRQLKEQKIAEIALQQTKIEMAEKEIKKENKQLASELKKQDKYEELSNQLNFCDESLKAARKIKNEIMQDVRKEVEERTREEFFSLIWKKTTYKDVKIDKDYNVSVIHEMGYEAVGTLSAGERQVLALSFIAALNAVSGFNVPIVIDTPLGRISKEPKRNIANNLPNYLKGKQVILLVTEEEYTPEVRERLAHRVGKEYSIEFREYGLGNVAKVIPYD